MRPGGRLTRRVELARGPNARLRRSKPLRHKPRERKPTELTQREARLQTIFHSVVPERGRCANCGHEGPFLEAHHAIEKQLLKRLLLKKGVPCPLEVIWDRRNAVVACGENAPNRCHPRHTLAVRRMGRHALRPENWEFAREHDLEYVLEAQYLDQQEAA